ncbi:hypothetical protein SAMN04488063_0015 [Halopelagius inordinatus]|uniref:Uncharacterized protein n=1 Tax=Halopelagius inordinatus TaxID=553467 RepID=A0A1I2WWY2_9EURY|nr:hypothetical protein [Halopelagius inordinatus]SFH05217.1 hypothetical protein SAMN04488063_0015 [Halopelagius inordinatus]
MAAPDPADVFDDDVDDADLTILPAEGHTPLTFDLDLSAETSFSVELTPNGEDRFDLEVLHGGAPLHADTVSKAFFDPGVARDLFTTTAARLVAGVASLPEEEAVAALADVLDEIQRLFADGVLHVVDEEVRELAEKVVTVTYSSGGSAEWTVTFDDPSFAPSAFAYVRSSVTIPAAGWADSHNPPHLPPVAGRTLNGDKERWQAIRRIWSAQATMGDAPPTRREVTGEDLREWGELPKTGTDVEAVVEAVQEHRTFRDVYRALGGTNRDLLRNAISELGLEDEIDTGVMG